MKTLFWANWGPLVKWDGPKGVLHIEDLNPDWKTKWVLTRWELFKFGAKMLLAAVSR